MAIENTPSLYVLAVLVLYAVAYIVYSKWIDRNVWQSDASKPTPAHVYLDGVEFFPVGRYVLYGFQFKSVAALGPIVGPIIAVSVWGWLPALIWILLGNFFIGWVQDYSAMMLSVRNEGRSFGPLAYELLGDRPRTVLLGYLLFYFILITAAFVFVLASVLNTTPGSGIALIGLIITAVLTGQLIYRVKMNILAVTGIAIVLMAVSIAAGTLVRVPAVDFLGKGIPTLAFWALMVAIVLFIGSIVSLPSFIAPMNYVAFFPTLGAVVLVIIAGLLTPATGVTFAQVPFKGLFGDEVKFFESAGPIWPLLFVTIACGAISGWHSLVSSGISSRQLDIETDARPVGAGGMLTEGLVALSAFSAVAVLAAPRAVAGDYVAGAVSLTVPIFTEAARSTLSVFFALFLLLMGITVQTLITRYWRVVSGELFGGKAGAVRLFGQKHIATIIGLAIPVAFTLTGSWINLWVFFGGTNQLLAGFALAMVGVYLVKVKRANWYVKYPALFMIPTTLGALLWEAWVFGRAVILDKPLAAQGPLVTMAGKGAAAVANVGSVIVGLATFVLGSLMAYYLLKAYARWRVPAVAPAVGPVAATDLTPANGESAQRQMSAQDVR